MGNSCACLSTNSVDISKEPPEREGEVVQMIGVIKTPPVCTKNAPSISGQHKDVKYLVHDLNPNCTSKNPNLTIIFFHGITFGTNDEWKETWTTRPTTEKEKCICWPQIWLPEDLNDNVRILSLSYDSNVVASVHNDVTEIGKNLVQSLIKNSSYQSLWEKPVVMVAHSFGGLVLKSLVVEAHKHVYQRPMNHLDFEVQKCCEKFLNNLKGVVFYSVPHAGGTEGLSKYFKWQCQQINKDTTQLAFLKNMESFNPQMEQLSVDFNKAVCKDLNIYAFGEGLPIDNSWGILVPIASATRLSNNNNYKIEDANHFTICKPPTKDHPSYSLLLDCLKICMKQKKIFLRPLPYIEVALEDKANAINILLQKEPIVALVGMGGSGKTTLSKKMYQLFHNQYDKSSFLEDVKSKDINDVKKQLLHDLCDIKFHKDEIVYEEDLNEIKQCLISKKVLVVVDDVGELENLEALQLLGKDVVNVNCKSKILVNCRNWQILKYHVSESAKMDMTLLDEEQAKELFMFHAFKHANHGIKDFENISMKIIKACGGLPLSLEVLGCYLCKIHILEIWEDALHQLEGGQSITGGSDNEVLWKKLRICYDALDEKHQNMFLDIACFFNGSKKNTFCRMWSGENSSPMLGLQNLKDRSLIKWAKDGVLYMHEQLQDMGQNIAMEVPMNRFIWKPKKDIFFLQKNEVVENLKGISLKRCKYFPSLCQINPMGFHNLKYLDLTEASPTIVENFIQGKILNNLRWLCFKNCNLKKLPSNLFYCSHLQVLDLTQCHLLQKKFDYFYHNVDSSLNVDRKKISTSIFSQLSALQELHLSLCLDLQELPTSIGQLNALQKLDLSHCIDLQQLPTSIGQLSALQELDLSHCFHLQELPTSIGQLSALQELDLSWCLNLQELPTSIGQLSALQELDLSCCLQLQELPTSIGQLSALQELDLSWCLNLQKLPISIGQLSALKKLDLWGCSSLEELPTSIGQLSALKKRDLWGSSSLEELPPSIGQLSALEKFYLWESSTLEKLPTSIGQLNAFQKFHYLYGFRKFRDLLFDQLHACINHYSKTASFLISLLGSR